MEHETVDYHKVREYLEGIASTCKDIDFFIGFSEKELHTILGRKDSPEGVLLIPYKYEGSLNGNNQRTLAGRMIHFAVLQTTTQHDFIEESKRIATCENIGFKVLGRIHYDSRKVDSRWLYDNFDKNTVEFHEIRYKTGMGLVGMEFVFELKTPQPLGIDPADWTDIDSL